MARRRNPVAERFEEDMFRGKVIECQRLRNTVNGNARYRISLSVGESKIPMILSTKPDSSFIFTVNWAWLEGETVLITVDKLGRITNLKVVE